jgi:hypothetical protein
MTDGKYQPLTGEMDDLPRTLRRERENRERAAREQTAVDRATWERGQMTAAPPPGYGAADHGQSYDSGYPAQAGGDAAQATVTRIKVPFFSLMVFFLKAVFAAIPALIILIAMLYGLGLALQAYFPQLIKMKILISFPG